MHDAFAPVATPDTAPYWEAAQQGRLCVQRCRACTRHYFYPRPFCRYCASDDVEWVEVSGRARLTSYVINARPLPGAEDLSPVIALVTLEEGPRLLSNVVGVEPVPEALPLDLPLRVAFEPRGGQQVPVFTPDGTRP